MGAAHDPVYAIGQALRLHAWHPVALAPVNDWDQAGRLLAGHSMLRGGLLVAPVAVPAGLAIGGLLWAWRIYAVTTGLSGRTRPARPCSMSANGAVRPGPRWARSARPARYPC